MLQRRNLIVTLFLLLTSSAYAQSVGVFLPIIFDTKELVEGMKSDPFFSKADIKVFLKLEDFMLASSSAPFDIAILPSSYALYNSDYVPQVSLVAATGEPFFMHQVVSFEKDLSVDFSVGVIDEVGRKNLKQWIKTVCSKCGKQKDVKKARDLYNLLALGSVNAILVSPYNLEVIKKENDAKIFTIFAGEKEDFPALFTPKGKIPAGLDKIKPNTFSALGLKIGGKSK